MSSIFFTADTHFGHANIIKYCNRPFSSVDEMDEIIIEKWNNKVKSEDAVYHLGDFSFKKADKYLSKLNGYKIFTTGDHDGALEDIERISVPLALWKTSKIQINNKKVLHIEHKKVHIFGCHWCMRTWPKSHFNSWHLYGHSHGRLEPIGKSWDVGVDNNNFEPLSFDEIVEIMKNRPDNPNLMSDYHNI